MEKTIEPGFGQQEPVDGSSRLSPELETQDKPELKRKIEEKEGKPYEVVAVGGMLEIIEQGFEKGRITMVEDAEYIAQKVEAARAKGIDLSSIPDLDTRIEQLRKSAPMGVVESSLKMMDSLKGKDREKLLCSWYYHTEGVLEEHVDSFEDDEIEKIRKKLKKIKKELGLN